MIVVPGQVRDASLGLGLPEGVLGRQVRRPPAVPRA